MRALFNAVALVALLGCATSTSTAPPVDRELSWTSDFARAAFEDGATAKAIALYEKALQRARAMDDATEIGNAAYNLALCQIILGQPDQASASLAEAKTAFTRSRSNPADVLLLEATIAQRQGKWQQSLSLADQVLSASPDASHRFQVALLKGTIACEQGDTARARAALAEAEKIRVTTPTLLAARERLVANIFWRENRPAEAAAAFDRAAAWFQMARRWRDMALALRRAAEAYRAAGDAERAEDRLFRAQRSLTAQGEQAE